jgi:hypothetical protein
LKSFSKSAPRAGKKIAHKKEILGERIDGQIAKIQELFEKFAEANSVRPVTKKELREIIKDLGVILNVYDKEKDIITTTEKNIDAMFEV